MVQQYGKPALYDKIQFSLVFITSTDSKDIEVTMIYGIIGAMPEEIEALKKKLEQYL